MIIYVISVGIPPPTDVRATVLTPRSVEVTWTLSSSFDVTGYLISYTTTASYASGECMMVSFNSAANHTLSNLEEGTLYTVGVRAITNDGRMSGNIGVSVTTYTDGK